MASYANRGKYAEGQVKSWLDKHPYVSREFIKQPDAHAGSFQPVPADFIIHDNGQLHLVEVKETEKLWLPQRNFGADQIARMRKWQLTGARCHVVVLYRTSKIWHRADLDHFLGERPTRWTFEGFCPYPSIDGVMEEILEPRK